MRLSQSNVIFFCLFAAFVVFITLRGEMPKYLDVLFKTQSSGTGASGGSGGGDQAASIGGALSDPVGALTGSLRRGLGIGNGLPSLGSIGSSIGSIFGF